MWSSRPSLVLLALLVAGAGAARLAWVPSLGCLCVVATAGLACRRYPLALLVAALAAATASSVERDVRPAQAFARICRGSVAVRGELVGGWKAERGAVSAPIRLESIGSLRGPLEPAAGRRLWMVVRGEAVWLPGLGERFTGLARCEPGSAWVNVPRLEGAPRLVVASSRMLASAGPGVSLAGRMARVREHLHRRVLGGSYWERPGNRLARALVLGDRTALPPHIGAGLRRLGLGHLLAVSGLHVAIVGAVAAFTLAAARPRLRLSIALLAVAGYAVLVGPSPSVLRAAAMAGAVGVALLLSQRPRALDSLALALAAILVLDPAAIRSLAFQLTAAATLGLLVLVEPLAARLGGLPMVGRAARILAVPLAAQVATLPWALAIFCRIHPASALLDLVAVPMVAGLLVVGLARVGIDIAKPGWGVALEPLVELAGAPLVAIAELPPASWQGLVIYRPPAVAILVALALAAAVLAPRWWTGVAATVVAGVLFLTAPAASGDGVELVLLDVGQGDAILLRDGRHAVLVDGGGWGAPGFGARVLIPALAGLGVRRLDGVVATHADSDHCGGLLDLAAELRLPVARFARGAADEECVRVLAERVERPIPVDHGDRFAVGRLEVSVLGPTSRQVATGNDSSLVLAVEAFGRRFLLTGDIERRGEVGLVAGNDAALLRAGALKIGHHGSRTSTSETLLGAVGPRLGLLSVGRGNSYGHPAAEVVDRLQRHRVVVLRTDRDGRVRIAWDRHHLAFEVADATTERGAPRWPAVPR